MAGAASSGSSALAITPTPVVSSAPHTALPASTSSRSRWRPSSFSAIHQLLGLSSLTRLSSSLLTRSFCQSSSILPRGSYLSSPWSREEHFVRACGVQAQIGDAHPIRIPAFDDLRKVAHALCTAPPPPVRLSSRLSSESSQHLSIRSRSPGSSCGNRL